MNPDPLIQQPDREKMREILQVLEPLELADFDQTQGRFRFDAGDEPIGDPDCPVCVGLRIALDCFLERNVERDGSEEATYTHGNYYACEAAGLPPRDLDALLHKHGAPELPFGNRAWQKRPFLVFKPAFEEVLGDELTL